MVAYLSGWTAFFIGFSGAIAAALLALAAYAGHFVPEIKDSPVASKLVALAALWFLTLANLLASAMIMAAPRVYYAMAQDRTFARTLARVNPRSGLRADDVYHRRGVIGDCAAVETA